MLECEATITLACAELVEKKKMQLSTELRLMSV
jgi:hypothetical protein